MKWELLKAGDEERGLITECSDGVPAISVVVGAGWSKISHKHFYNANSGVGVIFGANTKKLLYLVWETNIAVFVQFQVRRGLSQDSTNAPETGLDLPVSWRQILSLKGSGNQRRCTSWGTCTCLAMEIVPFLTQWLQMYLMECCNHVVKCYRTRLEAVVKDPRMRGCLTKAMIVWRATSARSAIMCHSNTTSMQNVQTLELYLHAKQVQVPQCTSRWTLQW